MKKTTMMEQENIEKPPELRPDELVPYVREYLGLLEDKKVLDSELKRCMDEYRKTRDRLLKKKQPIDSRFNKVEEVIKNAIVQQKLPGLKYKQYIFTIEERAVYKPQVDKIMEALHSNEHFSQDKKALAKIIANAVKKKVRDNSDEAKKNNKNVGIKIRILN